MNNRKPVTALGWAIKRRLAELQLDQQSFCKQYGIPPSRLSNLIHGTRKANRYRQQVIEILGIHMLDQD
ncbi:MULTISPECIES: hypothetical protein [Paenibacillus]|uniref:hypothetical protein n=1 Tax=Paenibacillus TaxID=44249 RepID=UPI000420E1B8|nr:hypothetical protein [Paenibacillus massiliensis]